jgi:hypothetical protein
MTEIPDLRKSQIECKEQTRPQQKEDKPITTDITIQQVKKVI